MPAKKIQPALGHRERQIMDSVFRRGEASVGDVLASIPDPPTYSTVRKMMSLLEEKGLLRHRREGTKYIYRPVESTRIRKSSGRTAPSSNLLLRVGDGCCERDTRCFL